MSFATMKPLSMSTTKGCSLISLTPIFNTINKPISSSYTYLSKTPSNPIKLNLSCSYSSSSSLPHFLSLNKKTTHFPTVVSVLTEDDTVVLEDPEQESGELFNLEGNFEDGSEEEEGFVEAVGDAEESDEAEAEEEEYVEPPEEAKLFVGNLPYDIDSEGLARLFEKAGVVEIAEVIYNRMTEQSRGFGFVTMSTVEEAEKGVELYNRHDLSGRLLTVNKAAPRGSQPERPPRTYEPSFRMYVGNIPWDLDDARLEQIFSEHGKVVTARVVYDRETGRSRGFGFVSMSSEAEMNDAIAKLDGESFNGRSIRVNVAEERPKRNTF